MNVLRTVLSSLALAMLASQSAYTAPDPNSVYFQDPAIGGSGCPGGTTSYALTPDGQTLSILFDAYLADPGNKTCNIAVPVHVPNGFQVSLMTADYRGWIKGRAELSRSYFFAGQTGPSVPSNLSSGGGEEYTLRDNLLAMSEVFAKCGTDVSLRINSRIRTQNSNSTISVDSLDLNNGMIFHLQYRRC